MGIEYQRWSLEEIAEFNLNAKAELNKKMDISNAQEPSLEAYKRWNRAL